MIWKHQSVCRVVSGRFTHAHKLTSELSLDEESIFVGKVFAGPKRSHLIWARILAEKILGYLHWTFELPILNWPNLISSSTIHLTSMSSWSTYYLPEQPDNNFRLCLQCCPSVCPTQQLPFATSWLKPCMPTRGDLWPTFPQVPLAY